MSFSNSMGSSGLLQLRYVYTRSNPMVSRSSPPHIAYFMYSGRRSSPPIVTIPSSGFQSSNRNRKFRVYANTVPGGVPALPPPPPSGSANSWILGFVLSVILPFFTNKWGPLWVLKSRIENAVQTVEHIAEAVEKVAEGVDKIAEDIADDLPEGNLKNLVSFVENVAEKTAKTADSLDNIIDKVQEAQEKVECIVESVQKDAQSSPKTVAN